MGRPFLIYNNFITGQNILLRDDIVEKIYKKILILKQ